MSLQNLPEDRLYNLLPEGIISLDQQRLIQAVVGGFNDRVDDMRAYVSKLELLLTGQGLPETDTLGIPTPNAVIALVQSPKGKVYKRSLEIKDSTPADGDPALLDWVASELQLGEEHVLLSASYGVDVLRTVDANVLPYLAATMGAVLWSTAAQDPTNEDTDARRILRTWFPRLQFKGTAQSFETLGRLLGFDEVQMTPLWSRVSPRVPNDIGAPENNPDFSTFPDYHPKQVRDNFYDPWDFTDGPYYTWTGTATTRFGTNSTEFYTQAVNGFNPFIKVSVVGLSPTDPDPALSPYVLTGGGPETKAYVNPSGTGLRLEALAAGSSFNGMAVHVQSLNNGTHRLITITEQLSSIKYRSSFYDLALAMDFDRAQALYGTNVVTANKDLQSNGTVANFGTAASSPYRPWKGGSYTQDTVVKDWLTEISSNGTQSAVVYRTQADLTDRQLDTTSLTAAGVQVIQAMEEVRPATRQARNVSTGYLIKDQVGYADYNSFGTAFTTAPGVGIYSGTLTDYPYPPYAVQFSVQGLSLAHEQDPFNQDFMRVRSTDLSLSGTYDYSTSTYLFKFQPSPVAVTAVCANYQPTSTEVVREQPAIWPDQTIIAITADNGWHNAAQFSVNNMIRGWNPDAFFHAGDNSYNNGLPSEVFHNMEYEADFIAAKKFFICSGNHDFYNPDSPTAEDNIASGNIKGYGQTYQVRPTSGPDTVTYNGHVYAAGAIFTGISGVTTFTATGAATVRRRAELDNGWNLGMETNFLDYLPGNGRYYHVRIGHVELFVVNDGYNNLGDPGFRGNNRKPGEPDGNWCEAPYTPVGGGRIAPSPGNPIYVLPGVTYTVKSSPFYGEYGELIAPSYVVYNGGTYTSEQSFVGSVSATYAYMFGEPRIDPAPPWAVLRQARRYKVVADPGNNYVDYGGQRYYGGDIIQANLNSDWTIATTTGTTRLDRMNSTQAEIVKNWIKQSKAPWKVVMYHHPAEMSDAFYSSHEGGLYPRTEWPWADWGADVTLHGHVHAYARLLKEGVVRIIVGIGGSGNVVFNTSGTAYRNPYSVVEYVASPTYPPAQFTDWGAMLWRATPTQLSAEVWSIHGVLIDSWGLAKPEEVRAYQARPEDELAQPALDFADEYPWRRDLVSGGELVDTETYNPPSPDVATVPLGETVAVFSQTGAQYDVTLNKPGPEPPRFQFTARDLTPYVPGQAAIAFTGTFRSLDQLSPRQRDDIPRRVLSQEAVGHYYYDNLGVDHSVDTLDKAMEPGWQLYHFGLVQGVLVADPVKFNGKHHRDGLVAWYPLNEHPRDGLDLVDHSVVNDPLVPESLYDVNSRAYDVQRGWYSRIAPTSSYSSKLYRSITEDFSLGLWINCPDPQDAVSQPILSMGPLTLSVVYGGSLNTLSLAARLTDGSTMAMGSLVLEPGWNYYAITWDDTNSLWKCYIANNSTPFSFYSTGNPLGSHIDWDQVQVVTLQGVLAGSYYGLHDLRLWNQLKTDGELDLAHYHQPTPTAVLYRPAFLQAVNDYDRYGVRVLDSGYAAPELLPTSIKTPTQAWVSRYDSTGEYDAQSRFKETGVGGGNTLPALQPLGLQWNTMSAAGTAVVSTWQGGFMGFNGVWAFDNPIGYVMQLVQSGSTIHGIIPTWVSTGTAIPWPNPMVATNPCRDRIWVQGDDNSVYEIKVVRSGYGAFSLSTEKLFSYRSDAELKLTGTEGVYAPVLQQIEFSSYLSGVYRFEAQSPSGTVFPRQVMVVSGSNVTTDDGAWSIVPSGHILGGTVLPSAGTITVRTDTADPIKVYHPLDLIYADQPTGAQVSLTDTGFSRQLRVDTNGVVYAPAYSGTINAPWLYLYGNEEVNSSLDQAQTCAAWTDPSSFGLGQNPPVAALRTNGQIAFSINQTALPGYYRLEITSGNIGQVDESFDGFRGVMTVGDYPFEARLCQGQKGANFTATDTFEFYLPHTLPGSPSSWLLSYEWNNALLDTRHGTARQLKITGIKLVRLSTSLYQLQLTSTGSQLTEVSTEGAAFPATPGGWMAALTSWGTAYGYTHESKTYNGNETFQSRQPYSNLLTATTVERREDLVMTAPQVLLDAPEPVLPVLGPITIT